MSAAPVAGRLMLVVTSHESVNLLLLPLLPRLVADGWQIDVVCSPGPVEPEVRRYATVHAIPMRRAISPLDDLSSLRRLRALMRERRPDVVVASTPKAGMLGMAAARAAGVRARVFHVWGARWDGVAGLAGLAMRSADRLAAAVATDVLAVSASTRDLLLSRRITRRPVTVLGAGGSKGVDLATFRPAERRAFDPAAPVLGFAGRLAADKGIDDVVRTFVDVSSAIAGARVEIIGDLDAAQPIDEVVLRVDPRITWRPAMRQESLAEAMRGWDVLVFPSRREGLPNVVIEAAACGVPTVGFDVTGVRDAVVPEVTGRLVPLGGSLGPAVLWCLDPSRHDELSAAAVRWARAAFDGDRVTADFDSYLRGVVRRSRRTGFYRRHGKRWLDVVGASTALVLLSPVIAATALTVRWRLGRPVLFTQERGGLHGSRFRVVKFRTLTDERDAEGELLPDAERLTPVGQRLRSLSLDEVPELVNVLRGDMSLVGPRPLVARYLDRYTPEQARRHEVRPGLTGWVHVNGRNALDWESKFALDVWYVDHVSLRLDLAILARTVGVVLRREGVSGADHATMPEFFAADAPPDVEMPGGMSVLATVRGASTA